MQFWFDAWNHDQEAARREYDFRLAEIQAEDDRRGDPPDTCKKGKHTLTRENAARGQDGRWRCLPCRRERETRSRQGTPSTTGGPAFTLTDEQALNASERYSAGETSKALAKEFGTTSATVIRTIRRVGGTVLPRLEAARRVQPHGSTLLTSEQEIEVMRRYTAGESGPQLAAVFGVPANHIRRCVVRQGGTIRNHSEATAQFMKSNRENQTP